MTEINQFSYVQAPMTPKGNIGWFESYSLWRRHVQQNRMEHWSMHKFSFCRQDWIQSLAASQNTVM